MSEPRPYDIFAEGPPPVASSEARGKGLRNVAEWVGIVAVALIAAFLVKTFLIQPFYIPSESMRPTLEVNDRVLVNKLSYRLHDVNRGDVVVFERPEGSAGDAAIKDLIKRVVGLPGETVEGRDGAVFVDGDKLPEPYLPAGMRTGDFDPVKLDAGQYWVMGDNRPVSGDSRGFGPIDEDLIEGRAFVRFWPLSAFGWL